MEIKKINELIPIANINNAITVLGRDLHEFLEIGWDYSTWIKRMCEYGFVEGSDYSIHRNLEAISGALSRIDHQLTMDMAKEISMIQRNEKGKQARQYFIECEKKLKRLEPQTYIEALEAIIAIEKKKQLAEIERDKAIATKAEIGTRREATAMNTASQLSKENTKLKSEIGFTKTYATIKKVEIATQSKFKWKPLKDYSNDHEYEIRKVNDVNYGFVNCYHADVWYAVYDIDLAQLIEG